MQAISAGKLLRRVHLSSPNSRSVGYRELLRAPDSFTAGTWGGKLRIGSLVTCVGPIGEVRAGEPVAEGLPAVLEGS